MTPTLWTISLLLRRSLSLSTHARLSTSAPATTSPTRCILYVPGNDEKKVSKALNIANADCVVLDCEDGVALSKKKHARDHIRHLLDTDKRMGASASKYAVRINSVASGLALDDLSSLFAARATPPSCIFVPKTNTTEEVEWLYAQLDQLSPPRVDQPQPPLRMFFYIESAIALVNMHELIKRARTLSARHGASRFQLDGFVFGSDDYCADTGITRTKDAAELTYARQKIVAHCKAYFLKCIDMVYIDFKDLEGLRVQSEKGARMGFTGKQCIHPAQVDVAQQAFTPSPQAVEWARGLVEAFERHQLLGAGAFTYKDQMIDMPSLLQAKNVLAIVDKLEPSNSGN